MTDKRTWEETTREWDAAVDKLIHEFAKASGLLWCVEKLNDLLSGRHHG